MKPKSQENKPIQEATNDLTTKSKAISLTKPDPTGSQALEVKANSSNLIVDPRVESGLTKTKEIIANITAENITQTLPTLTQSITQTNTALQATSQKVIDAVNTFIKLGYTGNFDNSAFFKKFYRSKAFTFHPDKQADKTDEEKKKNEKEFKDLTDAYEILSDREQIKSLIASIKNQERLLIEFKNKVQAENIPLTTEQQTTVNDLEKKSISAEELRMLDMKKRFEDAAAQSAKATQEHSAALLVNFQNQIRKITEQTFEPALAQLPDILNPSYFSFTRRSSRVFKQGNMEDIVTSEIQDEIIDPYTRAIKELYKSETLDSLMIPDDQKAYKNSYKKALDGYKEKLLTALEKYKKENSSDQKLSNLINNAEIKLGLKKEDRDYTSWAEPEKKSSQLISKTTQQKLADL